MIPICPLAVCSVIYDGTGEHFNLNKRMQQSLRNIFEYFNTMSDEVSIWWKAKGSVVSILHNIIFRSSKALLGLLPQGLHKTLNLRIRDFTVVTSSQWTTVVHCAQTQFWVSFLWPQHTQVPEIQNSSDITLLQKGKTIHSPKDSVQKNLYEQVQHCEVRSPRTHLLVVGMLWFMSQT